MIHGPGCPVCVLPIARIDMAIACAQRPNVTLCAYGDLMRVPGSRGSSLLKAKAEGADIRMVYSTLDAIRIAEKEPDREVVFFAIGFETTTPPTALAIRAADEEGPRELLHPLQSRADAGGDPERSCRAPTVSEAGQRAHRRLHRPRACQHRHRPAALSVLRRGVRKAGRRRRIRAARRRAGDPDAGPPDQRGPARGREPIHPRRDRIRQREGAGRSRGGVRTARELRMARPRPGALRRAAPAACATSASTRKSASASTTKPAEDNPACECGAILRGVKKPRDCKLFGTACTPDTPMGSCMVSPEGACSAHWTYGRFREAAKAAPQRRSVA